MLIASSTSGFQVLPDSDIESSFLSTVSQLSSSQLSQIYAVMSHVNARGYLTYFVLVWLIYSMELMWFNNGDILGDREARQPRIDFNTVELTNRPTENN